MQRKFSWFFLSRFQKESFCLPKGALLHSKRSPFALQNESFCTPKGVLLKCPRISPSVQLCLWLCAYVYVPTLLFLFFLKY